MTEDTRTDEQRAADAAANTLNKLTHLDQELGSLKGQLEQLADWEDTHKPLHAEHLNIAVATVITLRCRCLRECILDLTSTLPIRGLDYGDDETPSTGKD